MEQRTQSCRGNNLIVRLAAAGEIDPDAREVGGVLDLQHDADLPAVLDRPFPHEIQHVDEPEVDISSPRLFFLLA